MNRKRGILGPQYFSQTANEPPAGGAPAPIAGQVNGVAPHSAAAQAQAAAAAPPAGGETPPAGEKPPGYVPVAEVATERQKRHAAEAAAAQAQAAAAAQLESFKKALGLSEGQTPEQLQAAAATAQQTAKEAQAKLSVFQLAKDAGGDAHALLDSASFLNSIKTIDPADNAAMTAAIKAAVESNNNLALRRVAPGGSHDAGQGGGGGASQPTISDAIRALATGK